MNKTSRIVLARTSLLICTIFLFVLQVGAETSHAQSQKLLLRLAVKDAALNAVGIANAVNSEASQRGQNTAHSETMLRVIVTFDQLAKASGLGVPSAKNQATASQNQIASIDLLNQQDLLIKYLQAAGGVKEKHFANVHKFKIATEMALSVNLSTLESLINNPSITVREEREMQFFLDQSVPIVYPSHLSSSYTGSNSENEWVVAVLDSGVDSTHLFLDNKVVSEACYSTNDDSNLPLSNINSSCPGGVTESTLSGSGEPCSVVNCDHGTLIAGVAAGDGSMISEPSGVAREGKIISIKVASIIFEMFPSGRCPTSEDCASVFESDVIKGLERVYALRNSFSIAAVNLSFGVPDELFSEPCDEPSPAPSGIQQLITNLKSAGIATVVASGNGSQDINLPFPACLSEAIAVGSSNNADAASATSNSSQQLDLYAPGQAVRSSVPGGGYQDSSGTSIAAAHVSGAWAVVKSKNSGASVDLIETLFKAHGPGITKGGQTRKRIDLDGVLADPNAEPAEEQPFIIRSKNGKTIVFYL